MNADPLLPNPPRSEAFAEDILEFFESDPTMRADAWPWLLKLAPLAVAAIEVAFAVLPPG